MLDGLDRFWRMRSLIDLNALSAEKRAKVLPFIRVWAEAATGLDGETRVSRLQPDAGDGQGGGRRDPPLRLRHLADCARSSPTPPNGRCRATIRYNAMAHIGFTVAYNMSEQPAATVNCGYDHDGLPIGLQIVGRRFDDLGVLSAAMAFETMRASEARPWPEPPNQE